MKYVKSFYILVTAVAALMAFAGTASATILTSPPDNTYTDGLVLESEGYVPIDNPIATINCVSDIVSKEVGEHGSGITVGGFVTSLSFLHCTNSWHVTVVSGGSYEIHSVGSGDGTVTSSGMTIEATRFGVTCRYKTENTDIGYLTDGTNSELATLHIQGALPSHGGSFLCGNGPTAWTGSYTVTSPTSLIVDP